MIEFILVLSGLCFGALCLGVGYLLGKKNKVKQQIVEEISKSSDKIKEAVSDVAKNV